MVTAKISMGPRDALAEPPPERSPIVVFDNGNHQSWSYAGEETPAPPVRSLVMSLPEGQRPRPSTPTSPIIEVEKQRYHFGAETALYDTPHAIANGNKLDHSLLMFLATVPDRVNRQEIDVVALHHSPENDADCLRIRGALQGAHEWIRNGVEMSVSVRRVSVELEGAGTWHFLHPDGYADSWSLLIDIGGGSWVACVLDNAGRVRDSIASSKGGTIALARSIAKDSRLTKKVLDRGHTHVDLGEVMTGLECGHRYVDDPGLSWEDWLEDYVPRWWQQLKSAARSDFHHYGKRIGEVIVTGGGAHLVADAVDRDRVSIPKSPHVAATVGTWIKHSAGGA